MNKFTSLLPLFILISIPLYSYDKTIKDSSGRITGYLDTKNGKTYEIDKNGRRGNYITSVGVIKDKSGRNTGYMKQKGNRLYYTDRNGNPSDYIESDGTIKDSSGRKKGTIK